MADERDRDRTTDERFGRRVHEGMNAGISRNAHTSGESRLASGEGAADRGAGGYGDDTGFTGGTRGAGSANTGGDSPAGMNTGGAGGAGNAGTSTNTGGTSGGMTARPAEEGHTAYGGTPAISRPGGVGHEAPSGMEELEHDERGHREHDERGHRERDER